MKINVKTHGLTFPKGGTDAERMAAHDIATDRWWKVAQVIAYGFGMGEVTQEGRSGGWLVAEPDDIEHRDVDAFEAAIRAHLHRAPILFGEALSEVMHTAAITRAAAAAYNPEPPEGFEHVHTEATPGGCIIITYRIKSA